ncbi:ataxin-1-like isoform X2 [Denticeps clupeoides]|nr:ataxin-1-like isoform X2 [Denticeps clupeoides]
MEDFLLCADAYPEFCLRSCTVQHISTSRAPELTRLHILLDNSHTQDFLDVFVEFPFFVCGRGWSSCCPQRTSQMCGLSCHQLFVGDVCLVLTPSPVISPAPRQCGLPALTEKEKLEQIQVPMHHHSATDGQKEQKRHSSAPELNVLLRPNN